MHRWLARSVVRTITATALLTASCAPATGTPTTAAPGAAAPSEVPSLDWLVGTWTTQTPEGLVTEQWSKQSATTWVGRSDTTKDGAVVFFEQMRLERAADGTVTFFAQPMGRTPATPFRAVPPFVAQQLTVENPDNEFPQRIEYRREGETLTATISGAGQQAQWQYRRGD
ncbi:MAG: hypothetical protein K1X88_23735 [Nannocystaceae bacterium]|nr:hypothetical protein [Nannocystaceae bacterium]